MEGWHFKWEKLYMVGAGGWMVAPRNIGSAPVQFRLWIWVLELTWTRFGSLDMEIRLGSENSCSQNVLKESKRDKGSLNACKKCQTYKRSNWNLLFLLVIKLSMWHVGSYKWLADVVKQAQKPMLPLCQFNAYIGSLTTNLLTPWFLGGHPFLAVNVNKIIIKDVLYKSDFGVHNKTALLIYHTIWPHMWRGSGIMNTCFFKSIQTCICQLFLQ